jgi:HEAT repeat protein
MVAWQRVCGWMRRWWNRPGHDTPAAAPARPRVPRKIIHNLCKRLHEGDLQARAQIAQELGRLGEETAVAPLLSLLSEPAPAGPAVAAALLQMVPTSLPGLLAALDGGSPLVSLAAADVLAQAGAPAVPGLVRLLTDPHRSDRSTVAEVLGRIGPPAQPAVTALLQTLLDRQASVREAAAAALPKINPQWPRSREAEDAVPLFVRGLAPLAHQPAAPARNASEALIRIGPAAVSSLLEALEDDEHELRQIAAARILAQIRPVTRAVVPALVDILNHKPGPIRQAAALALGEIGLEAHAATPALCQALAHWSADVRKAAAQALAQINAAAEAAIPRLLAALADATASVRQAAADSLERFGAAAVPGLLPCLKHREGDVRRAATRILGKAGPDAASAVTLLVETLVDGHEPARRAAQEALPRIDPDWPKGAAARAALPVLLEALQYREEAVPQVLPATAAVGFAAVPRLALPARDDWHIRCAAAETLGKIATAEGEIVAALRVAQKDEHFQVCQAAAAALQRIAGA